ncbi:MAG: DUF1080 domain-containing protein [Acidobacteria bacterium]|nr:DUF1080 domain-containing protein [Acidobacteriota bacterium]
MLLPLLFVLMQDWQPLEAWKPTPFPKLTEPRIEGRRIELPPGAPMTGVTAKQFDLKSNYEIRFEAARVRGNDFFCSLTFPYGDSHATWVNGGWGGDIVGVSSIDNWDASENETRTYFTFEEGRFYRFRIQVTNGHIKTWIDDKLIVDLAVNGRTIGLRRGMGLTRPLSLFSYNTAATIRNVEYRSLPSR